MSSKTIGFAVAEEDVERLDRLTKKFGYGNRSAFLREAMRQMETIERAQRLAKLQAYGGRMLRGNPSGLHVNGTAISEFE